MDKTKSLGRSERAQAALEKKSNQDIVRFQMMVGGRRAALGRLTGNCFVYDESGCPSVLFEKDKGGKSHKQKIRLEDVEAVKAYFDAVGPNERLFPKLDKDLDLHGMRAENARRNYQYYAQIASTPQGREQLRQQLWARFTDSEIGCKAWLLAKANGDKAKMRKLEYRFRKQMADGDYYLRGANREAAIQRGRPIKYDRLSILATSVFSLSHWRLDICAKSYLILPLISKWKIYHIMCERKTGDKRISPMCKPPFFDSVVGPVSTKCRCGFYHLFRSDDSPIL